jgi:hypothetical protein
MMLSERSVLRILGIAFVLVALIALCWILAGCAARKPVHPSCGLCGHTKGPS